MSPLTHAAAIKLPAASDMERGGPAAATGVEDLFAALMKELALPSAGDSTLVNTVPDQTEEGDRESDQAVPEEPVVEVATMIPIAVAEALPVPIPVQTAPEAPSAVMVADEGEPMQVPISAGAASSPQTSGVASALPQLRNGPLPKPAKDSVPVPSPKAPPTTTTVHDTGMPDPVVALLDSTASEDASPPQPQASVNAERSIHTFTGSDGTDTQDPATLLKVDPHEANLDPGPQDPSAEEVLDAGEGAAPDRPETNMKSTPANTAVEPPAAPDSGADALQAAARESKPIMSPTPAESRVPMSAIPHTIVRLASDPEQKTQSVKLRLDPPRLGEVSVDLKLGENGLTLRIVSQTAEARDLLQQDLPRLQDLLKASGLNLQLFSATCDLPNHRSERQTPPDIERTPRFESAPSDTPNAPTPLARRQYDTSMRINAHA